MFGYDIDGVKAVVGVIIFFLMGTNLALVMIWRELWMIRRAARYAAIKSHRAERTRLHRERAEDRVRPDDGNEADDVTRRRNGVRVASNVPIAGEVSER